MQRLTIRTFTTISLACILFGCSGSPTLPSVNHNSRVSIIVIHFTTADFADSMRILTKPSSAPVSSHYLIPEPDDPTYDKKTLQNYALVDETRRAWHAGTSYWAGKSGLNDQSIGIELVNRSWCHTSPEGRDPETGGRDRLCFFPDFADEQIALLVELLDDILERHPDVRPTHIIGHSDIAPGRKIDPGPRFPWQRLAALGYGAWYEDATVIRFWEQFRAQPLPLINLQEALGAYGYKIELTGEDDQQTRSVVRSFQLHFRPWKVTGVMDREAAAILFALLDKYYPSSVDDLLHIDPSIDPDATIDSEQMHEVVAPTATETEAIQ